MRLRFFLFSLFYLTVSAIALAGNTSISGTHAIGNGRVCVYAKDADITGVFGPTYSSPTLLSLSLVEKSGIKSFPVRMSGVWKVVLDGGRSEMRDAVSPDHDIFIRDIRTEVPLSFKMYLIPESRSYLDHLEVARAEVKGSSSAWMISLSSGVPFYSAYPSPSSYHALVFTTGQAVLEQSGEAEMSLAVNGKGALFVVISDSPEGLSAQMKHVRTSRTGPIFRKSLRYWKRTQRVLPKVGSELDSTVRMVSNYVISQQDLGGGVLAGKNYHMAYVRDQYGVSRGLLAMGHLDRAKAILDYYFRIWQEYGLIHNAQPMGFTGQFHCHEDDNSEITGYLVVQAMDYYYKSNDLKFLQKIQPMLKWAVNAQQSDIIDGMLPFNGDETYIAGGIIPRHVMCHGSAEATLLFIEGSRRLLEFLEDHPSESWSKEDIEALRKDIDVCSSSYRSNFFEDGKFCINNPRREEKVSYPATRPGVCLYPGAPTMHYPVTYHFKKGLYFCEDCMKKDTSGIEPPSPERYSIPSAFLFPVYIDSRLFSDEEKRSLLDQVVDLYRRTGRIDERNIVLGYDYGLFLYALSEYDHPLSEEIYRKMMDLRDSSLSWVEYYVDGIPYNTPCRPWESSVNIAAALKYCLNK